MKEQSTAKTILRTSKPMDALRENDVERYAKLEELVARLNLDAVYSPGETKESRRETIARGTQIVNSLKLLLILSFKGCRNILLLYLHLDYLRYSVRVLNGSNTRAS